jgi:hypothetical protein
MVFSSARLRLLSDQQNPTSSPAIFIAALSNEDPGRSDIATSFWMLPSDVVGAALGFPQTIGGGNIAAWEAPPPRQFGCGSRELFECVGCRNNFYNRVYPVQVNLGEEPHLPIYVPIYNGKLVISDTVSPSPTIRLVQHLIRP